MPPAPARMSLTMERAWVLLAFVLVSLAYSASQTVDPGEGRGYGGQAYHAMAKAMPREFPPQGIAPHVYRWGTPLVAAGLAKSQDWVIAAGFDRLNLAFNALSVLLLTVLLQRHVPSLRARALVIMAFMVEPHSPVRLAFVHPMAVEPAAMAGLLAGLLGIDWFHSRPHPRRAVLLALLVSAGMVFHEAILIVGICVLFMPSSQPAAGGWRNRLVTLDRTGAWLPLVLGMATLAVVHAWVTVTPSDYSALAEALRWLTEKSPLSYGLAWFLVFGPLLVVPLFYWRTSAGFLHERPAMLAYLALCALVGWIGDGQTERLLTLASPVVYILIARALPVASMSVSLLGGLAVMQAMSSRVMFPIGGPIAPPQVRTEIWERFGSPTVAWALSYQNMWSQFCAPAMVPVYLFWYGITGGCALALLWYQARGKTSSFRPAAEAVARLSSWRRKRLPLAPGARSMLVVFFATAVAIAPVVWLALSGFYRQHYATPGAGYIVYNLARIWLVVVLLMAFWSTGTRIVGSSTTAGTAPGHWRDRFVEAAFVGAAAWSVAVVLLAALHLYFVWAVIPAVTVAVALAIADLTAARPLAPPEPDQAARDRWGLLGILLRMIVISTAAVVLVTIAMWGHFGGDNDVPGNYLPYYEMVLQRHSIAPNDYWVHYFASKGNGLAFLANVLSDVNGAALATYLILLLGAGMICRLAARHASVAPAIGLVGACLYLQYYAGQGAYAKSHIIRNTFILSLVLFAVRALYLQDRALRMALWPRLVVVTAIIILSPLAVVLVVPILVAEAGFAAALGIGDTAKRSLVAPLWALAATAVVCTYNLLQVGVPELHAMPSVMGQLVSVDRFSQWIDPGLAYIDSRLWFLRVALPGVSQADRLVALETTRSVWQTASALWTPATATLVGGALLTGAVSLALSRWRNLVGTAAAAAYLLLVIALLAALQLFAGGPGTSMGRFTDFGNPLGIALGVLILAAAWNADMPRRWRGVLALSIGATACAAMLLGSTSVLALAWRPSAAFLVGHSSYAAMNEGAWDTLTANRIARSLPDHARVEMVNFLPGFTAVPDTPFQRPDGCVYLEDYTKVLFGTPERVSAIYASAGVDYFLFDLSDGAPLVWSGFSPLFTPESIRSRMRLVAHEVTATRELYVLTWRDDGAAARVPEAFLQRWGGKLEREKATGYSYGAYTEGLRRVGSFQ